MVLNQGIKPMRSKLWLLITCLLALLVLPATAQTTTFSDIIFARDVTLQTNQPMTPLTRFPDTVVVVVALMDITGLQEGAIVTSQWLHGDTEESISTYIHNSPVKDFRLWTNLSNPLGITPGTWTLRILLNGELAREGTFEVTTDPFIFPLQFGTTCGNFTGELFGHRGQFEAGTQNIYAQVRYTNFPPGTPIQGVWVFNGEVVEGAGLPIQTAFSGTGQRCFRVGDRRGLAGGIYELRLQTPDGVLGAGSIPVLEAEADSGDGG